VFLEGRRDKRSPTNEGDAVERVLKRVTVATTDAVNFMMAVEKGR